MLVRRVSNAYAPFDEPSSEHLADWSGAGTPLAGFRRRLPFGSKSGLLCEQGGPDAGGFAGADGLPDRPT